MAVTQAQYTLMGRNDAVRFVATFTENELRTSPDGIRYYLAEQAAKNSSSKTYRESFVNNGLEEWRSRRRELPDLKAAHVRKLVTQHVNGVAEDALEDLRDFEKRFHEHASNAFRWCGDTTLRSAARWEVYNVLQTSITMNDGGDVDSLYDMCYKQMLNLARDRAKSSSFMVNELDRERLAAFAMFVEFVERVRA